MKRPLPARMLSEAWDAVIEAQATDGYVNVSAIAAAIRRTGRFQNVPVACIEKAVLHATLAIGAVVEFDKNETAHLLRPEDRLREPDGAGPGHGTGATVQRDSAQLSTLREK